MQYRIERDVTIESRPFQAGHVVDAAEIPAGSAESCLHMGHISVYEPPPVEVATAGRPCEEEATKPPKSNRGKGKADEAASFGGSS